MNFITKLKSLCSEAIVNNFSNFSDKNSQELINLIEITQATQKQFGHYQCNSAMKLAKLLQKNPRELAQIISDTILTAHHDKFSKIEIAGPGFINFTFSTTYIEQLVNQQLQDPKHAITTIDKPLQIVIDFSSPNIAKEMHVGHLRSTIIGECLSRILDFFGHQVLRLNHIGDWGTQFGMLIAYLKQNFPDPTQLTLNLSELMHCYRQAKIKFDQDPEFKLFSQQEVVKLQAQDPLALTIWQKICTISQIAYQEIYDLLDVELIDRGESFYNSMLAEIVNKLTQQQLITISDGAKCVFLDGFTNRDGLPLPLIIQKADGGYNYATTDLAAIYHRVHVEHAEWLIYVVDAGQAQHFNMVFAAAKQAKFFDPNKIKLTHIPFGLVLGADGKKFRTRSGETEKLIDLITAAIDKAKALLLIRDPLLSPIELNTMAQQLGINAIKYADLSNNRTSDYTFNYDRMLQFEGNTAAFLMYAYVRIKSIQRKITGYSTVENIKLIDPTEIDLALQLCQFDEALQATVQDLLPNRLTDYLFKLSEKFHVFFHHCRVEGDPQQNSRLMLCQATAKILLCGFQLLGLTPMDRM